MLDEHLDRLVAEAPPLTPAQRDKLAVLLRPSPPGGPVTDRDERRRALHRPGPATTHSLIDPRPDADHRHHSRALADRAVP